MPEKELLPENYDDLQRFISYFYQVDLTKKLGCKEILEIGIGNKTVSNYLKEHGLKITTCDFHRSLAPDCVADIRHLPFKSCSYKAVLAFEILEHLPWVDVEQALNELHRVTKKHALVSIPYNCHTFEAVLILPDFLRKFPLLWKLDVIDLFFRSPYPKADIEAPGDSHGSHGHYWEMGRKSYPIDKIRTALKKRFKIMAEVRPVLESYLYFFVLEKM